MTERKRARDVPCEKISSPPHTDAASIRRGVGLVAEKWMEANQSPPISVRCSVGRDDATVQYTSPCIPRVLRRAHAVYAHFYFTL